MVKHDVNPHNKFHGITKHDVIRVLRPVAGSDFRDRMTVGQYMGEHAEKWLASEAIREAIRARHIRVEHGEPPALEHLNRDMESAIGVLPAARPGRV